MGKFFWLNNPKKLYDTPDKARKNLGAWYDEENHLCEIVETYSEVKVLKKTYDRSEVLPTTTPKDGDEGIFIDHRDGNEYKTLVIGGQEWMNENLAYYFSNEKYCSPGKWSEKDEGLFSSTEDKKNGYLYQWSAAMKCAEGLPDGWRLPTIEDFEKSKLGSNPKWNRTYTGYRGYSGTFFDFGREGYVWSDSNRRYPSAWFMSNKVSYLRSDMVSASGFSVRLVRDIA